MTLRCRRCRSSKLAKNGRVWRAHRKVQRYICNNCGTQTSRPLES